TVQTAYTYHSVPMTDTESEQLFASLRTERPDGLIIFPVGGTDCRRFIEGISQIPVPTVIFNDTQDYMTEAWFTANPHTAFIGPDGYDEGRRAALLMQTCGQELRHLVVVCTRHNSSAQVSEKRVHGVCDGIRKLYPAIRISHVELDPTERIAPSMLARRLIACYDSGEVDCMYISSGVTHIACAAIEKIERRLERPLPTFVIGHECSKADKRYLLEGRQRGYIKQDVYTQGMTAIRDLAAACLEGVPLEQRLYRSSVFIR
ncbi:MAG: substrate-binding domain-containing protein, partial [Clostridia bacterium]|nr:substrate-binding domain-containing protein [Clostridia bacterium]